jgi:hypothetical protein
VPHGRRDRPCRLVVASCDMRPVDAPNQVSRRDAEAQRTKPWLSPRHRASARDWLIRSTARPLTRAALLLFRLVQRCAGPALLWPEHFLPRLSTTNKPNGRQDKPDFSQSHFKFGLLGRKADAEILTTDHTDYTDTGRFGFFCIRAIDVIRGECLFLPNCWYKPVSRPQDTSAPPHGHDRATSRTGEPSTTTAPA